MKILKVENDKGKTFNIDDKIHIDIENVEGNLHKNVELKILDFELDFDAVCEAVDDKLSKLLFYYNRSFYTHKWKYVYKDIYQRLLNCELTLCDCTLLTEKYPNLFLNDLITSFNTKKVYININFL